MSISSKVQPLNLFSRLGFVAFTFFLVKGLLWLAAPFVFLWFV